MAITGSIPIINQKVKLVLSTLVVGTPGIVTCQTEVSTHAALVKHMREIHQPKIGEYRCTCRFHGETALSVATHKRYCGGVAPKDDKEHKCEYCGFSSTTKTGLKVHVSRVHS